MSCFDSGTPSLGLQISDEAPQLCLVGSQQTCSGQELDFSTGIGTFTHAPMTGAFSYSIDWGDGSTPDTGSTDATGTSGSSATIVDPGSDCTPMVGTIAGQHTYATAGNYYIVVTVTDPDGLSNSQSLPVTVDASAPPPAGSSGETGEGDISPLPPGEGQGATSPLPYSGEGQGVRASSQADTSSSTDAQPAVQDSATGITPDPALLAAVQQALAIPAE